MGTISGNVCSKYVTLTEGNTTEQDQALSASPPETVIHKVSRKT